MTNAPDPFNDPDEWEEEEEDLERLELAWEREQAIREAEQEADSDDV